MTRVLIIGASGFVGKKTFSVMRSAGFEVFGTGNSRVSEGFLKLDCNNKDQIKEIFDKVKPEVVIDSHGLVSPDQCEKNKEEAYKVNVDGTRNLVEASRAAGSKFVYISTDYVFDRKDKIYREMDLVNPLNIYGKTKAEAERIVLAYPNSLVLRVSTIYGYNDKNDKSNFAKFVYMALKEGKQIRCITDQWTCPTFIDDIAASIIILLDKNRTGIYHVVAPEFLSRYDFAMKVAEVFGLDSKSISPAKTADMNFIALRPLMLNLSVKKLESEGLKTSNCLEGLRTMKRQMEVKI